MPGSDSWQRMASKLPVQLLLDPPTTIDHDPAGCNDPLGVLLGADMQAGNRDIEIESSQPVNWPQEHRFERRIFADKRSVLLGVDRLANLANNGRRPTSAEAKAAMNASRMHVVNHM